MARLGVLMESASLVSIDDEPFARSCARVLRELAAYLDAETTIEWAGTADEAVPLTPMAHEPRHLVADLTVGGQVLGRLHVQRPGGDPFDQDDRRLVRDVAAQVASGWSVRELAADPARHQPLATSLEDSPIAVLVLGGGGEVLSANRAFGELLGTDPTRLRGHRWDELLDAPNAPNGPNGPIAPSPAGASRPPVSGHPVGSAHLTAATGGPRHEQHRFRRAEGTTMRAHVLLVPLPAGAVPGRNDAHLLQVLAVSATDLEQPDELTGVATRHAALRHLDAVLAERRTATARVTVGVIGLDHFSALNDAYGHAVGDEALRQVARVLCDAVRPIDVVGRLGGDEFLVVFDEVEPDEGNALGASVAEALEGLSVDTGDGTRHAVGASIGLAWSAGSVDSRQLLAVARRGLREAKRRGRGRLWQHRGGSTDRGDGPLVTARDLQLALDRNEFVLLYQPIVTSAGHRLRGVEALLRWDHPSGRRLSPDRFLPQLLESGQINAVGRWAVAEAIGQLADWRARPGGSDLVVNVNVSPAELADPHLAGLIAASLAEAGIEPSAVCVELTEQALDGTVVSTSGLRRLSQTGVRLALDDLGTGVSTLSHLRMRPLHGIKIDRSFIDGLEGTDTDRSIVRALVTMAHGLGLEVTAEGVETSAQAEWLASVGCHLLQGWRFSRAVEPTAITHMIELQPAGPAVSAGRAGPASPA